MPTTTPSFASSRYGPTWHHQSRGHLTHNTWFPIGSQFEPTVYLARLSRYAASKVASRKIFKKSTLKSRIFLHFTGRQHSRLCKLCYASPVLAEHLVASWNCLRQGTINHYIVSTVCPFSRNNWQQLVLQDTNKKLRSRLETGRQQCIFVAKLLSVAFAVMTYSYV